MNSRFKQRGLTITEILIGVAILAIMLALGVPTIGEALDRRRLSGVVTDIQSRIALARSEAIKRNEVISVAITRTTANNWCLGLRGGTDAGCDCTVTNTASVQFCGLTDGGVVVPQRLTNDDLTGINMLTDATDIFGTDRVFAFDPIAGTLTNLGDTGSFVVSNSTDNYQLQLTVTPLGVTTVCRTAASKVFSGFDACP